MRLDPCLPTNEGQAVAGEYIFDNLSLKKGSLGLCLNSALSRLSPVRFGNPGVIIAQQQSVINGIHNPRYPGCSNATLSGTEASTYYDALEFHHPV